MKVLVTGDRGFIGTYIVKKLLADGHMVLGIDNNSKYGPQSKSYDGSWSYMGFTGDVRDEELLSNILGRYEVTHMIMGAAKIGGISYFHQLPYTLLAENEQMMAAQFNSAIKAHKPYGLRKVTVISSSMVYESATKFPSFEGDELKCPPPISSYGFQKLATEYFARAAFDEFGLPYTIVRPFNCVGTGEVRALTESETLSGDIKLAMSHVVPDLIQKIVKGQNPLHILGTGQQLRCYTSGDDLARGIVDATISLKTINKTYNLSTTQTTSVLKLAKDIWTRLNPDTEFAYVSDEPFKNDVQCRVANSDEAKIDFGWKAKRSLSNILDEVVPWVVDAVQKGLI